MLSRRTSVIVGGRFIAKREPRLYDLRQEIRFATTHVLLARYSQSACVQLPRLENRQLLTSRQTSIGNYITWPTIELRGILHCARGNIPNIDYLFISSQI
jgi:hypothetical protein